MNQLDVWIHGCPVCRQRTRHLVFCRWRPEPIDVPPLAWLTLMALPFWTLLGVLMAGWTGVGVVVVTAGLVELAVLAGASVVRHRPRPRLGPPYREEVVGALYPREMRHHHRRKGVCTDRCRVKEEAA